MLIARLERVSVDSIWARRSSGVRGALLKWQEMLEAVDDAEAPALSAQELYDFELSVRNGFEYLEKAARESAPR